MIAVCMRDHCGPDGSPWVDIKISGLTIEAMFSKADHEYCSDNERKEGGKVL
jgi:hypothetical protein